MKGSTQCAPAVKKGNSMLEVIKKEMENKIANLAVPLYRSMLPLGIMCTDWSLSLKIAELEKSSAESNKDD